MYLIILGNTRLLKVAKLFLYWNHNNWLEIGTTEKDLNILQDRKLSENYDYWKKKKEKRCDYMKFSESTLVYFLGTILPQIGKCSAE